MKALKLILSLFFLISVSVNSLSAHCQVPCGIFEDDIVFGELITDLQTIEKAMKEINRLGEGEAANMHQVIRWVNNKESHAQNIQDVMSAYYLAQRIKLDVKKTDPERYTRMVELAHEITVLAMKCKQSTDLSLAEKLGKALHSFQEVYKGK